MIMEFMNLIEVIDIVLEKVVVMFKEKGFDNGVLCVFVVSGGCSGYQYGMVLVIEVEEGDQVIEKGGVCFLVDFESVLFLMGV